MCFGHYHHRPFFLLLIDGLEGLLILVILKVHGLTGAVPHILPVLLIICPYALFPIMELPLPDSGKCFVLQGEPAAVVSPRVQGGVAGRLELHSGV
jgi:hypothetical protein